MISLNVLDYSPIDEGSDSAKALLQTTELVLCQEFGQVKYRNFLV